MKCYVRQPRGFTLVELLIGMALSGLLIAGVSVSVLALFSQQQTATDRAELAERGRYAAEYLSAQVAASWSRGVSAEFFTVCLQPDQTLTPGVQILRAGDASCLPASNLVADTPMLVLDTVRRCAQACSGGTWPAWVRLSPGCHITFSPVQPELRKLADGFLPSECASATLMHRWDRKLYYLRDYAWHPGDNIPSLMVKSWRADEGGFGRAEMLAPGIESWILKDIDAAPGQAVTMELVLLGFVMDAANSLLNSHPPENFSAVATPLTQQSLLPRLKLRFSAVTAQDLAVAL